MSHSRKSASRADVLAWHVAPLIAVHGGAILAIKEVSCTWIIQAISFYTAAAQGMIDHEVPADRLLVKVNMIW